MTTLYNSYRCPENFIVYASTLFPNFNPSHSNVSNIEGDGIYLVKKSDALDFLRQEYGTMQLRLNSKTKVINNYRVITFGKSKGSTYENVLIYPTNKIKQAILLNNFKYIDSNLTLCKLYVALTRAKHKVAIVIENEDLSKLNNENVSIWKSK